MTTKEREKSATERLKVSDAIMKTLDEARMVLPGVQALFGFQLIAVFNNGFATALSRTEQLIHFVALVLTVMCIALLMAPAACDRQTGPMTASARLIEFTSTLVALSMIPLTFSICADMYLIGNIILKDSTLAFAVACFCAGFMTFMWFILPRLSQPK